MGVKTLHKKGSTKKDSQFVIRISSEERDRFVALCEELDTSAAREIRHFIRKFPSNNSPESEQLLASELAIAAHMFSGGQ